MKVKYFIVFIFFASIINLNALEDIFYEGEELTYNVSFLGINLGEIKMYSIGEETYDGKKVYRCRATMQSNPSIPFAYLNAIFYSWMSPNLTHSYKFEGNTKFGSSAPWVFQKLIMEYDKNNMIFERWANKKLKLKEDVEINSKINDGSSLFFFARQYVDSKRKVKIPTVIDKTVEYTYINFTDIIEPIEIDAVDYQIETIYFDGKSEWEGIYGLNGEFEGWFSNDEAAVPIKAKMKVYVGSVVIELIEWKRGEWMPPKVN